MFNKVYPTAGQLLQACKLNETCTAANHFSQSSEISVWNRICEQAHSEPKTIQGETKKILNTTKGRGPRLRKPFPD